MGFLNSKNAAQEAPSEQIADTAKPAVMAKAPVAIVQPVPRPEPKVVPKPVKPKRPKYMGEKKLLVLGGVEWVTIDPPGIRLEARIDTGAETSSLHADPILPFERDGKRWVRFTLPGKNSAEPVVIEKPVVRRALIKRHESESQMRHVVSLWLHLGEIRERVEVTLTDRSDFEYSLLVGRNFLTDTAVVDVSRRHAVK